MEIVTVDLFVCVCVIAIFSEVMFIYGVLKNSVILEEKDVF